MDQVIGVDIGTQSTKAVLVGRDGAILAQAKFHLSLVGEMFHGKPNK